MSIQTADAVILGAGIVGAACADRLSQEGLRVTIVEQDLVGAGATAAGMGHVVVMDDSEAQFALTRHSQQLWKSLQPELPQEAEYRNCGTLWVAADEQEMDEVRRKHCYYTTRGVPVQIVAPGELEQLEPNLRPGLHGALLVPEDAVLYPPCAARFFVDRSCRCGATLLLNKRAVQLEDGLVQLDGNTTISSPAIVNATGAWAADLMPELHIKRRKGHLVITDRYPQFIRHQIVELGYLKSAHTVAGDSVAFNVQPRSTGQILIGSSRQYGVDDPTVGAAILSRMLQRAFEYMPALEMTFALRAWTGFRAATPDKLPLIGLWPGSHGLYVASGHEGLGITTSLATADLLADQIFHRTCSLPREPYLPARAFDQPAHV